MFRCGIIRVQSWALTSDIVATFRECGFIWVREVPREWKATLRNPTVGRFLEFSLAPDQGSWPITSKRGRALLWRQCP
jgi:hypothetical protein